MSIKNGVSANEENFNDAFLSRKVDDVAEGKIGLGNTDLESGAAVGNAQKAINKLFSATGIAGENDVDSNNFADPKYIADGDSFKQAIEKVDQQLFQTQTDLDAAEVVAADHESRITSLEGTAADHESRLTTAEGEIDNLQGRVLDLETADMNIGGNKTFTGNVTVQGNLEVQGTMTAINSTELEVEDANMTLNKGGTDGSAEGSGVTIERPSGNAGVQFDSSLNSKWKLGVVGAFYEVIVSGVAQVISGVKTFVHGILTDDIGEKTLDAGVNIDGVHLKDGLVDGRDVSADGAAQDAHHADASIHFTESSINHLNIQNIGTNSHDQIDAHIANTANPHSVTKAQVGLGDVTNDPQLKRAAGDFDSFTEKATVHVDDIVLIEDSEDALAKKKIKASLLLAAAGGGDIFTHEFKLNGYYSQAGVSTVHDGVFVVPYNCILKDVIMYHGNAGSSGSTSLRIRTKPQSSGAWTSIFTVNPSIAYTAGSWVWAGIGDTVTGITPAQLTTPNLSLNAKDGLICDVMSVQGGSPTNCGIVLVFEKV